MAAADSIGPASARHRAGADHVPAALGRTRSVPPVTDRFPSGTVILDTHNALAVRGVNRMLARTFGSAMLHWPINDAHELERVNPRLRCTAAVSALAPTLVDELTPGAAPCGAKLFGRLAQFIPALRDASLRVRYEFDSSTA